MERDCVTHVILFLPHLYLSKTRAATKTSICLRKESKQGVGTQQQPFSQADVFITAAHLDCFHLWLSIKYIHSLLLGGSDNYFHFHPLFSPCVSVCLHLSGNTRDKHTQMTTWMYDIKPGETA